MRNTGVHKIVHISSVHDTFDTRILYRECVGLHQRGYDVTLVTTGDRDFDFEGVRVVVVPRREGRFSRIVRTGLGVVRRAIREQGDVYHFHDPELLGWARLLRATGTPVVYDMHENVPKSLMDKHWIPKWLRPLVGQAYRAIERTLLRGMPVVLAETSYSVDYDWLDAKAIVLNYPIVEDVAALKPSQSWEVPMVGYVGGISPERGSLVLLEAIGSLQRDGVGVGLAMVGPFVSEAHREELDRYICDHRVRHVRFFGRLPSHEALSVMAGCSVGAAVLQPIANYLESYPTKVFEYMALGIPVIASNFDLYRSVVETHGCGVCVDPTDPSRVAVALRSLIKDRASAAVMGLRGRAAVVESYSWAGQLDVLENLYATVLSAP